MRLYEFVSSNDDMINTVKDLLVRARAEGAGSVSLQSLANEFGPEVGVDVLSDVLNQHRYELGGIVGKITDRDVEFAKTKPEAHKAHSDDALKKTALGQALKGLK